MIAELLRPLLRWLFWNRRRPFLVLAALLITLVIIGRVASCGAPAAGPAPARPSRAPAAAATSPAPAAPAAAASSAPPQARPTVSPAGPAPAAALQAARAFLAAWAGHAPDRTARIRAAATPQLSAQVTGPAAAQAPVTAIDGPVTVTGQAAGTVSVSASTNVGPALLTVRLIAGRWLAAQLMLARTGD